MGNVLGGLVAGFGGGYAMGRRIRSDREADELSEGLKRAADVKPEEVQEYTADQAEQLHAAASAKDADGNPLYKIEAADGGRYSVTPVAGGETGTLEPTKRYSMGGMTQAEPFTQEQVDARRFRNQADVYSRFGMADKAASLHGLAKAREDEHVAGQIRLGAQQGMKSTKDMRDEEKMFQASKGMYEAALRMNRPDLAQGYYQQMTQNRDALLSAANQRAERVYRATGNISGYVDVYNRFLADGQSIDAFTAMPDGSHKFTINDGGKTRDVVVPKDKLGDYLLALRDPKRVAEIEQKRAELLFKAQADAQEALNKPVAIGNDQTLVVPSTGQTFAPGANRGFDPKEANSVLDDARRIILGLHGYEREPELDTTGKPNPKAGQRIDMQAQPAWTAQALAKSNLAERVFMKNPGLPPAMLAEIADKGQTGMAVVEIGGKQQRVPAVTYNGRTFILGGEDAGIQIPAPASSQQDQVKPATKGLGTRSVSGKIGMSRADDFPTVSKGEQSARDVEAGRILVAELGSVDQARRDLAEIDAQLKNPRLDGTQRGILQGYRNRLASGIAASS